MRQYVGESTFVLLLEPPVLEGSDSAVLSNVSECRHYLGQHSGCGSESVSALRKACWLFPWWLPGAVLVSCPGLFFVGGNMAQMLRKHSNCATCVFPTNSGLSAGDSGLSPFGYHLRWHKSGFFRSPAVGAIVFSREFQVILLVGPERRRIWGLLGLYSLGFV